MTTMYAAKINSPITTLDGGINDAVTTITVVDASKLPTAPNLAVIGTGEDAETILYTGISTNNLTGVTRGFQGTAKAWDSGTTIARMFTAYDHDAFKSNIEALEGGIAGNLDDTAGGTDALTTKAPTSNVMYDHGVANTGVHGIGASTFATAAALATHAALTSGAHSFYKACRVYNNANISVNTATDTFLTYNSEYFDTDSIHSTASNTGRLTCQTAGIYLIVAQISYAFHATGRRMGGITLNAGRTIQAMQQFPAVATDTERTDMTVSTILELAVNDYVEVMTAQTSGSALNVLALAWSPIFSMVRIA